MSGFNPEIAAKAMMPREVQAKASSLHLGVHLHTSFVQVMVFDFDNNDLLWSEHFEIAESWQDDFHATVDFVMLKNWGDRVFRKTSISFDSPDFTLVPQGFLISGKEPELLKFSTNRDPENAETFQIPELGASLLFDLPHQVKSLTSRLPNARFYNSAGFFIKEAIRNSSQAIKFHILVQSGYMLVVACSGSEVKLTNHFGVQGNDDVLYHIANAALRLNVDMESAEVLLYGNAIDQSLEELLKGYLGDVAHWDGVSKVTEGKDVVPFERYSSLIHIICA